MVAYLTWLSGGSGSSVRAATRRSLNFLVGLRKSEKKCVFSKLQRRTLQLSPSHHSLAQSCSSEQQHAQSYEHLHDPPWSSLSYATPSLNSAPSPSPLPLTKHHPSKPPSGASTDVSKSPSPVPPSFPIQVQLYQLLLQGKRIKGMESHVIIVRLMSSQRGVMRKGSCWSNVLGVGIDI